MHPRAVPARRSDTRRAVIAWGIAAIDFVIFVGTLLFWSARGGTTFFDVASFLALPIAFGGVGALLTVRVPANPVGPLLLASTTGLAIVVGAQAAAPILWELGANPTFVALLAISPGLVFIPSVFVVLVGVPLIFPTGRVLSRRWWTIPILTVIAIIPVELTTLASPPDFAGLRGLANPFEDPELVAALGPLNAAASIAAIPLLLAAFSSLVFRYRRSDDVGRHQIRWVAASITVAAIALLISFVTPEDIRDVAEPIGIVALTFVPIAIGVAIVRYRLYDIDRIISRGISYAVISIVLIATYTALVVVLQGPLGGVFGEDTLTVAISTLVVAGLFQPVRRRVQEAVDRRFDRARVDADRTAGRFAARLRDEVDIETLQKDLAATVGDAVRPSRLGLWLRDAGP